MQIATYTPSQPTFVGAFHTARLPAVRRTDATNDVPESALAPFGSALSCDDLSRLMRGRVDQPISCLARWIVKNEVVSFDHLGQTLFPVFQFDPATFGIKPGVSEVIQLLDAAMDKEEIAQWFSQPNDWLDGRVPASLIDSDLHAVREAARADRFVALG